MGLSEKAVNIKDSFCISGKKGLFKGCSFKANISQLELPTKPIPDELIKQDLKVYRSLSNSIYRCIMELTTKIFYL